MTPSRSAHVDPALIEKVRVKANFIRREVIRLTEIAKSGHYGSTFSCADILAALYYHIMRVDAARPDWPDRDRLVLSKGHAAIAVYPVLCDLGYFDRDTLDSYTRMGSLLGDEATPKAPGIDFGSGALGHGLSVCVGMALGLKRRKSDARVYCLLGDGELNEGQIWEAALSAHHHGLNNLIGIVDRNRVQSDGDTEAILRLEPLADKWKAFGWNVWEIDGHDPNAVVSALWSASSSGERPSMIIAETIPGKGVSFMERRFEWHLGWLAPEDREKALAELE